MGCLGTNGLSYPRMFPQTRVSRCAPALFTQLSLNPIQNLQLGDVNLFRVGLFPPTKFGLDDPGRGDGEVIHSPSAGDLNPQG